MAPRKRKKIGKHEQDTSGKHEQDRTNTTPIRLEKEISSYFQKLRQSNQKSVDQTTTMDPRSCQNSAVIPEIQVQIRDNCSLRGKVDSRAKFNAKQRLYKGVRREEITEYSTADKPNQIEISPEEDARKPRSTEKRKLEEIPGARKLGDRF